LPFALALRGFQQVLERFEFGFQGGHPRFQRRNRLTQLRVLGAELLVLRPQLGVFRPQLCILSAELLVLSMKLGKVHRQQPCKKLASTR
jgi:hypothetical protein